MRQSRIKSISFSRGTSYLCTRDEAKTQCIISTSDTSWDSYIDSLIASASLYIEKASGKSTTANTITLYLDYGSEFGIPYSPLSSVTIVEQKTNIGEFTALVLNTDYEVIGNNVTIYGGIGDYRVIYTTTAETGLKQALLNEVAYRFENRGDVANTLREFSSISRETESLINPFKDLEWLG